MVWLGRISYGLYLWHYIFLRIDLPVVVALPLTIATAAVSWYLIEKPLRKWALGLQKEDNHQERGSDSALEPADAGSPRRDREVPLEGMFLDPPTSHRFRAWNQGE